MSSSAASPLFSKIRFNQGDNHVIEDDAQLPFEFKGTLGDGLCGMVEKVANIDGTLYARKSLKFHHTRDRKAKWRIFNNEVNIIKGLEKHHHIVRVFATYMSKKEFALLLFPVADCGDLSQFLSGYWNTPQGTNESNLMREVIQRSFGCLANGLEFLHREQIRHRDIKPGNILVHQGSVIYTDFGYSLDHSRLSNSKSNGRPEIFTYDYAAPEVIDYELRDSTSDIYSLGCVYLDLLSADLSNKALSVMESRFSALQRTMSDPGLSPRQSALSDLIFDMTREVPADRPRARRVSAALAKHPDLSCDLCQAEMAAVASSSSLEGSQQQPGWYWSDEYQDYYCATLDSDGMSNYSERYSNSSAETLVGRYTYHWSKAQSQIAGSTEASQHLTVGHASFS